LLRVANFAIASCDLTKPRTKPLAYLWTDSIRWS